MRWNDSLELFISSNISNILKPLNCHCLIRRVRSPGRQWSSVPGCSCWRSGSCWSGWPGSCPGGSGPGGYRGRTDGNVRLYCPSLYSREWAVLPPRHELQGNCLSSLLLNSRSVNNEALNLSVPDIFLSFRTTPSLAVMTFSGSLNT